MAASYPRADGRNARDASGAWPYNLPLVEGPRPVPPAVPAAAPFAGTPLGLAALLVALLTVVLWWPLRRADILPPDRAVLAAAAADAGRWPAAERAGWLRDSRGPLTRVLLAAEFRAWSDGVPAMRTVALAFHAGSALVLVILIAQLANVLQPRAPLRPSGVALVAALAAFLYALHPQRAAALTSLAGHGVPVATAAALLAALLQVASWTVRRPGPARCAAAALMIVSLLASAAAAAVPLVLVALDALRRRSLMAALRDGAVPLLATCGAWLLALFLLHGPPEALERPDDLRDTAPALTPAAHLAVGVRGLAQHALAAVWPPLLPTSSDAVQPVVLLSRAYGGPLLGLLGVLGLIAATARHAPAIAVALASVLLIAGPPILLGRPGRTAASPLDSALPAAAAAAALGVLIARLAPAAPPWCRLARSAGGAALLAAAAGVALGTRHEVATRADSLKWWAAVEQSGRGTSRTGRAWLYYAYARTLEETGELERAIQLYHAALAARPTLLEAHVRLWDAYFAAGEYRAAYNLSAGALSRWPGEPVVRYLLGAAAAALGDLPTAETHLRWAVERAPHEPRYRAALAALPRPPTAPATNDATP